MKNQEALRIFVFVLHRSAIKIHARTHARTHTHTHTHTHTRLRHIILASRKIQCGTYVQSVSYKTIYISY